ncbi:hypothetical protein [Pedobacter sp. L105]|uniref:DUF6934 family protein n=1 Tax=Pedobacter sp. L105 TaxID=1641871 RepID=UPI0020B15A84|nr:hypothetical protein [Pedobacter sp. L105]
MNLEHYSCFSDNNFYTYEFFNEGPKGRIKKVIRYTKIGNNPVIYNLGFGDEDNITGKIDDEAISNNNDRSIVLATVADTINDFINRHPIDFLFAKGNSPVKTRLYQIYISSMIDEIKRDFKLYGFRNRNWSKFTKKC